MYEEIRRESNPVLCEVSDLEMFQALPMSISSGTWKFKQVEKDMKHDLYCLHVPSLIYALTIRVENLTSPAKTNSEKVVKRDY